MDISYEGKISASIHWETEFPFVTSKNVSEKQKSVQKSFNIFLSKLTNGNRFDTVISAKENLKTALIILNIAIKEDYLSMLSLLSKKEASERFLNDHCCITQYVLSEPDISHPGEYLIHADSSQITYMDFNSKVNVLAVPETTFKIMLSSFSALLTERISAESAEDTQEMFMKYPIIKLMKVLNYLVADMFPDVDIKLIQADVRFLLYRVKDRKIMKGVGMKTQYDMAFLNSMCEAVYTRFNHLRYSVLDK